VLDKGSIAPRCNIGAEEVARRRRSAVVATVATAVIAMALVVADAPAWARFLVAWPVGAAAAVTWLQVVRRFCVAFGALGLQNFGRLGEESAVDAAQRAHDRRQALQMVFEGALIGLVVAIAIAAIPV
jgi:hypothetical protein